MEKEGNVQFDLQLGRIMLISIMQIILGSLCILWQVVNLGLGEVIAFVGTGLWCGLPVIFAGVAGLRSPRTGQPCGLGAWLGFSLLSVPLAVTLFAFSVIGAFLTSVGSQEYVPPGVSTTPYPNQSAKMSIDVVQAVCGVMAGAVSVAAVTVSLQELSRLRHSQVPYQNMNQPGAEKGI